MFGCAFAWRKEHCQSQILSQSDEVRSNSIEVIVKVSFSPGPSRLHFHPVNIRTQIFGIVEEFGDDIGP